LPNAKRNNAEFFVERQKADMPNGLSLCFRNNIGIVDLSNCRKDTQKLAKNCKKASTSSTGKAL
jgi:hypothetical protein